MEFRYKEKEIPTATMAIPDTKIFLSTNKTFFDYS